MRWLLAILEALAALSAAGAEPPRYTVTNHTAPQPAFQVVNRITTTAPLPAVPYADLYARVSRGEKIIALVNLPAADRQGPVVPVPAGWVAVRCDDAPVSAGRWECWKDDAGQYMRAIETYAAVGGAVAQRPFPDTTRAINARPVAAVSTSYPVITGTARTTIPVLSMGRFGGTNCTSYG